MGNSGRTINDLYCDCDECAFIRMTEMVKLKSGVVIDCTCNHGVTDVGCHHGHHSWRDAKPEPKNRKRADLKPRKQKPQVQMLPYDPHAWEARVVEHGAKKYARGNFRLPIEGEAPHEKASEYIRAAMGHLWAQAEQIERYIAGLEQNALAIDNDSGLPHLAHAMCSVSFAIQAGIDGGVFPKDPKASKKEKP